MKNKYKIKTDSLQYTLCQRKIVQKGENKGEETWINIGYYGKLEHLYNALVDKEILENFIDVAQMITIKEEIKEFIKQTLVIRLKER